MNAGLPRSDEVVSAADVQAALDRMAIQINSRLAGSHPLVITVMNGGQPAAIAADFIGVRVPDRFVFGFGMDVAGVWRNLPAIRALRETQD